MAFDSMMIDFFFKTQQELSILFSDKLITDVDAPIANELVNKRTIQ